jgi:hypothetical protein
MDKPYHNECTREPRWRRTTGGGGTTDLRRKNTDAKSAGAARLCCQGAGLRHPVEHLLASRRDDSVAGDETGPD